MFVREGVSLAGRELTIETGRMAKQADGSVIIRQGDTMVLVTAVASMSTRPGIDFMPLTCRLPGEDVGGGQDPRRLLQARRPHDRGRGVDLAAHRSPVAPAVPQGLALRHPDHRHGRLQRSRARLRRAGHDRRLVRAGHQRHPLGGSVRRRCAWDGWRGSSSSTRRSPSAPAPIWTSWWPAAVTPSSWSRAAAPRSPRR